MSGPAYSNDWEKYIFTAWQMQITGKKICITGMLLETAGVDTEVLGCIFLCCCIVFGLLSSIVSY